VVIEISVDRILGNVWNDTERGVVAVPTRTERATTPRSAG
jgi:hypothetical protein